MHLRRLRLREALGVVPERERANRRAQAADSALLGPGVERGAELLTPLLLDEHRHLGVRAFDRRELAVDGAEDDPQPGQSDRAERHPVDDLSARRAHVHLRQQPERRRDLLVVRLRRAQHPDRQRVRERGPDGQVRRHARLRSERHARDVHVALGRGDDPLLQLVAPVDGLGRRARRGLHAAPHRLRLRGLRRHAAGALHDERQRVGQPDRHHVAGHGGSDLGHHAHALLRRLQPPDARSKTAAATRRGRTRT